MPTERMYDRPRPGGRSAFRGDMAERMLVPDPSIEDLQRLAAEFHFALSDAEAEQYLPSVRATVEGYTVLDDLADAASPPSNSRDQGRPPRAGENPLNGWAWRCSIEGRSGGPLAGRTVAIKDNTAVAGLPLRLGTTVMEGFVADEDATVVTRLLDAGAEIIGKTAVPSFCFDGAGFLGEFEPQVLNPADHDRVPGGSSSGSAAVVTGGEVDIALGGDQGGVDQAARELLRLRRPQADLRAGALHGDLSGRADARPRRAARQDGPGLRARARRDCRARRVGSAPMRELGGRDAARARPRR